MTVRVETTPYGVCALDVLRRVVLDVKSADPMAAVTVLAPNNIAGIVARRHLARGSADRPGIAGIEVTTLPRVAERLATPVLAPRRPLIRPVLAAAIRRALADDPGPFRDIADHPGTVRALAQAHPQLGDVSESARHAIATASPLGHALVELDDTVATRLRPDWFDAVDVLTVAADHVALARLGTCVLYLPQALSNAETRFVRALADSGELTIIAGITGVKRADAAIERTLTAVGAAPPGRVTIGTAHHVITASDSDDEVRCVVRDVLATLGQTPAHRVAVLYSAARPYARLLHEHMVAAGVTTNGAGVRALDERAITRVLLETLALADGDVPRSALFRALANAPVRDFTGERIPVATWERASRSAGIVAGADWTTRLDVRIADCIAQVAAEEASDDPRDWLIERHRRDADVAGRLRAFASRLRDELRAAAAFTTWAALAGWCRDLFTALIGEDAALQRLPVEEQYAAAAVLSLLDSLEGLDSVDTSASLRALRDAVDVELSGSLPRVGRFGEGVLVAPISAAIGLEVDVVYLVGVSEDLYPGRLHPDALLPERARAATHGELPSVRQRLHDKHRHLLAGFAAASTRAVVSFPRGDLRRSTRRLPSRWLLPSLRALSGEPQLAATEWQKPRNYGSALANAGSFAGELLRTDVLASEQEWRTRQAVAAGQLKDDPVVHAGVEMIRAHATDRFTRFDGNLTGAIGLPDYAVEDRAVSPTALESYASCPHAFFVQRLLKVERIEQPEDIVVIQATDIGNLIHESMDALVTEYAESLPGNGAAWTSEQRARLAEIAVARAKDYQDRGLTGHPRLWESERLRISTDINRMLDVDDAWRRDVLARVAASELPFGFNGQPAVEIVIPGGRVVMHGSADKVDIGADDTVYITDIKTGSRARFEGITQDDPFVGGTKLQLPVYAYAARRLFGNPATRVTAAYWFVRKKPGRLELELTNEVEQGYAATLAVLVGSIASGLFPLKAPDAPDFAWVQCPYCNPDGIGHVENRERWERKRLDPALRGLVRLIDADAVAGTAD